MKNLRKLLLTFALTIILLTSFAFVFPTKASADGLIDGLLQGFNEKIVGCTDPDKSAGEAYLNSCDGGNVQGASDDKSEVEDHGALGVVASMIDLMYNNPPASGIVYAQQTWNQFRSNLTGEVYAQEVYAPGVGFNVLSPIQPYWAWARNLSYGFFIFIFIAIALQILFRSKIDGQNPVTLANSVPGAIISLALVTLSYAITGLTIDVITLGTNFVRGIYETSNLSEQVTQDGLNAPNDPEISVWFFLSKAFILNGDDTLGEGLDKVAAGISSKNAVLESVTTLSDNILQNAAGSSLINLIFSISIFFAAVKLFFELIRRYIQIIFNVILSPLIFLLGAMPGGIEKAIIPYLRGFLANAVVFIVLYAVFGFIIVFMGDSGTDSLNYVPPLIGFQTDPDGPGIPIEAIKTIIMYGTFITTPLIPDMVDKALNAPDLSEIIQNIQSRTAQGAQALGKNVITAAGVIGNQLGLGGGGK